MSGHPGLVDAAVVGMPDKILGERICAYVIPAPSVKPRLEEVVAFLKSKGASVLQCPERIEMIEELPMTKVGKVDKKSYSEDITKKLTQEGKYNPTSRRKEMQDREYQVVGKSVERTDGRIKATGKAAMQGTLLLRECSTAKFCGALLLMRVF